MARGEYTSLDVLVLNPGVNVRDEESGMSGRLDENSIEGSLGFIGSHLLGVAPIISFATA